MRVTVGDISNALEEFAPLNYQESYDNTGLLVGDHNREVKSCLLSIDCTIEVVEEAIAKKCQMIVSHHPIVFSGLKSLTGKNHIEQAVIAAIKNDISLYACHTNLDNMRYGVNDKIAEKLGLTNARILLKKSATLSKIITYLPELNLAEIQAAIHQEGAGQLGNYDFCSFRVDGVGTFRALDGANPSMGQIGKIHEEREVKLEVLCQNKDVNKVLKSMIQAHPYEEVAYDIIAVQNQWEMGSGLVGELAEEMDPNDFLEHLKKTMQCEVVKYVPISKSIKKVALCGGAGSFLLKKAMASGADAFITSDMKYHEFFSAEKSMMICDIGHYESEKYTTEIFAKVLSDKFPNFATLFSETNTNPIKYYTK